MKRLVFIVNPISGTSKKERIVKCIEKHLDTENFSYTICYTEYAGHAFEIASQAVRQKTEVCVAVGGDGTINEVARALVHTQTALGIIPCGSGNGLARHLRIPMDPEKAVRTLNKCVIRQLDYGRCCGRPFFCTCGVGFDAFISEKFAECSHRGPVTYIENILRQGLKYKPDTYTIEDEKGSLLDEAFVVTCANASQYGNNAYIAPYASMDDGLMDVIVIKPFSAIEAPQIALQLFNKTLHQNSHVRSYRAKKVRITRRHKGAYHCDGDPFLGGKEIDVQMFQHCLPVVINADEPSTFNTVQQILTESFGSWRHMQDSFLAKLRILKQSGKLVEEINPLNKFLKK